MQKSGWGLEIERSEQETKSTCRKKYECRYFSDRTWQPFSKI